MIILTSHPRGVYVAEEGGDRLVGDEIFAMTNGADDGPLWGFDLWDGQVGEDEHISVVHSAAGGPANRPYLRYTILDNGPPGEFGWNWVVDSPYGNPASPVVTRGTSLFIRFSFRVISGYNQGQKIVIQNAGSSQGGGDRGIFTIREWSPTSYRFGMGLGGGDVPFEPTISDTGWRNVQVEIRFSTTESASDGYMKAWINNDNYASPTYEELNIPTRWRIPDEAGTEWVTYAGYHQGDVTAELPRVFDHADFRLAPTFDAGWHASGS